MKILTYILMAIFSQAVMVCAQERSTIYPTIPGTSIRDYSRPGAKIEGNKVYPTIPGTSIRDYSKPGYKIEKK